MIEETAGTPHRHSLMHKGSEVAYAARYPGNLEWNLNIGGKGVGQYGGYDATNILKAIDSLLAGLSQEITTLRFDEVNQAHFGTRWVSQDGSVLYEVRSDSWYYRVADHFAWTICSEGRPIRHAFPLTLEKSK